MFGALISSPRSGRSLALEGSLSGRVLRGSGGAVETLASVEQIGGGHRREFNRSSPDDREGEMDIACRTADGEWHLDFLATEHRPTDGDSYRPRCATASDQQHVWADAFLRERVQGSPLRSTEERTLIERGRPR